MTKGPDEETFGSLLHDGGGTEEGYEDGNEGSCIELPSSKVEVKPSKEVRAAVDTIPPAFDEEDIESL